MIIALHSVLRAGAQRDYDERHAAIPDDLLITFARIGIPAALWDDLRAEGLLRADAPTPRDALS